MSLHLFVLNNFQLLTYKSNWWASLQKLQLPFLLKHTSGSSKPFCYIFAVRNCRKAWRWCWSVIFINIYLKVRFFHLISSQSDDSRVMSLFFLYVGFSTTIEVLLMLQSIKTTACVSVSRTWRIPSAERNNSWQK